jgi:hypothetical protein
MKGIVVILALLLLLGCGVAGCAAGRLLDSGNRNTARTSCVGLINLGSCNITQGRDTTTDGSGVLLLVGAFGVGCLALGAAWPSNRG